MAPDDILLEIAANENENVVAQPLPPHDGP